MSTGAESISRPALLQRRIVGPSNPFAAFPREAIEQSIPARFEQQVRSCPDKIAVKTTRESLTYAELNRLANQIAHSILATRGDHNDAVALLFGQSTLLIAAILGSLKAGKIYVPLDAQYLGGGIADILRDSAATLILTDASRLDKANEIASSGISVLRVDTLEGSVPTEDPVLGLTPDCLAYLFYTSGSTGKPKGVVESHRNVLHNIMRYTNSLHICASDRLTLLQSCSFSGSVSSLFCALLNGATSFPFSLQREGSDRMASWLSQEGITIYHSVPSIFRLLAMGTCNYPSLRIIRLEGDQASPKDVELYRKGFPDTCILVNGLGATECGIVRQYFVTKDTPTHQTIVPIGFAVEDMEVLLLDETGQQLGDDAVGEIAVRSRYLAPGYWRRPDLTAAAFRPDPAGGPERIYRTGDLGRRLPDGCLLHLGRKDFQVKIRGFRVEVAEVEGALLSLPTVQEAVVVAREDRPGDRRLVAYLVPTARPAPTVSVLRKALADTLPDYMVPAAFVVLETLPKTPGGKVDRRALPAPGRARPDLDQPLVAPRTPVEAAVGAIWQEVLGLDEIGVHDNFFDLGGHSLAVSQVLARVTETFHVDLPLRTLFDAPTVAALAVAIVGHLAQSPDRDMRERLLAELDGLSEAEAEQRLKRGMPQKSVGSHG